MIHKLEFDGGNVNDSLQTFLYHVFIETEGQEANIIEVVPHGNEFVGIEHIDWAPYVKEVKNQVTLGIENMKVFLKENNLTFNEDFKNWEEDSNEPGVQVIMEYVN